jgi:hypothetical protein
MSVANIINLLSSCLLSAAMYKQALILLNMKAHDPLRVTKIMFPIFNVCILAGMWLPYFNRTMASSIFFFMAGMIAVWSYYKPYKKDK